MKSIIKQYFFLIAVFSLFSDTLYSQDHLKVMTYNIWNGFDWGKDTNRKNNMVLWIKSKDPDVLALQELCGYNEEKLRKDAEKWGHPYVKILKIEGYPVGLTSKKPIVLKERLLDGLSHGSLHCETFGIDFFIVHLNPFDCNLRLKEARIITDKVKNSSNDKYIILGDFNAHSPFDEKELEANNFLKEAYTKQKLGDNRSNLRLGEFDYAAISTFIALPAIDVCLDFVNASDRFSYPCPASTKQINRNERIDYIFTSPNIGKACIGAMIFNGEENNTLSDHYPVMAEFKF